MPTPNFTLTSFAFPISPAVLPHFTAFSGFQWAETSPPVIYATPRTYRITSRLASFTISSRLRLFAIRCARLASFTIASRSRSFSVGSRLKTWRIPAMGFPLRAQQLDPFYKGDSITQPITLTIAVGTLPDPNTWTDIRLSITSQTGVTIHIGLADMLTPPVITGTGPWSVALLFPITEAASDSLPATVCTFQVDMAISGGGQAVLVEGLVEVLRPTATLP